MLPTESNPQLPLQPAEFHKAQLRRLMGLCFSLDEIKTLAFDIGIDYDEFGGETKTAKIREFILSADRQSKLDALLAAATGARPDIHWPRESLQEEVCPYRGLLPFSEEHSPFFFGRDSFVDQLTTSIHQRELVAVVGSSGSGKSSVVFAGLLPRLRQEGDWIIAPVVRPGLQPFDELAQSLVPLLESQKSEVDRLLEARKLSEALQQQKIQLWDILQRIAEKNPDKASFLLVVDQFEELYADEIEDPMRRQFINVLLSAFDYMGGKKRNPVPFKLVLTLRADFMGLALEYRPMADALQDRDLKLGPMNRRELEAAIRLPAEKSGLRFAPGLVKRILDDLASNDSNQRDASNLPLLEFALEQLWTLRINQDSYALLTHDAYEAIGEVGGAISHYADELFEGMTSLMQKRMRRLLVQMVHPGGIEDTRRRITRSEIGNDEWSFVEQLAEERLVVTDRDGIGQDIAEVIHEALIQKWHRMQAWMKEERPFRIWQDRMRIFLVQWRKEHLEDDLLRGTFLSESLVWLQKRSEDLSPQEIDFIQQSAIADHALKRRIAKLQLMAGSMGAGVLAGGLTAIVAYFLGPPPGAPIEIPNFAYAFLAGLQGALLGAGQAAMTILGILLAGWMSKEPSKYSRALGGAIFGAITGALLFLLLAKAQSFPRELSLDVIVALGFVIFGITSAGASLFTTGSTPARPIRQALLGMLVAGVGCIIAIWGAYRLLDLSQATQLAPTLIGFTALEVGFSGGMNFGFSMVSSRLRPPGPYVSSVHSESFAHSN